MSHKARVGEEGRNDPGIIVPFSTIISPLKWLNAGYTRCLNFFKDDALMAA